MSRPLKNDGKELGPRLFVIQVDPTRVHPVTPKANIAVLKKKLKRKPLIITLVVREQFLNIK